MRSLEINKVEMKYCLLENTKAETEEETYTDKNGVVHTIGTGTKEATYSNPITFKARLQQSTGEVEAMEFGLNVEDVSAIILTTTDFGIKETSLIWYESEVKYNEVMVNGVKTKVVDGSSADFKVVKISKEINQIKYVLKRNNK